MRALLASFCVWFVFSAVAAADDAGVHVARPGEATLVDEDSSALPEGHRPEVELRIEPRAGLMTGDPVHLTITVRLPEGDDVAIPRQAFGTFELHHQQHHDRPVEGGRREFVFEVTLLALEPGEHELPSLELRVVTADGTVGSVRTEPRIITIGSLLANEPDAEPRPPSAPLPVMQDDYTLAWILGAIAAILLTALITWLIARWWNRRPKRMAPPPPPKPAWDIALAKLASIRQRRSRLLEDGKQGELVDAVSDALREYFGARYDFNGLESTTDEVLSRLRTVGLAAGIQQEVTVLLGECDLVKFAKAVASDDQCDRMIESAVSIVRGTMPGTASLASGAGETKKATAPSPEPSAPAGSPITLPLALSTAEAIDPVVSAAVLGVAEARAQDRDFGGTVVVVLGLTLPDDDASRAALHKVHAKLTRSLEGRRTALGAPLRVVIEHVHESAREAAEQGREPRKTVYAGTTNHLAEEGERA